jgi:hypothetical protein
MTAVDTVLCRIVLTDGSTCAKAMLPDYPHHHETPPRPEWNPMPPRPADPDELIALIRAELRAELPERLHVAYVPSRSEPVGVSEYSAGAAGYQPTGRTEDLLDTGELGSPSWAPAFHRYVGAVTGWQGEIVVRDEDLAPFPWHRQLEGVRRWCASKHRTWYEHQARPLCWTLQRHVFFGGYVVPRAGQLEGITAATSDELFFRATDKLWAWVSNDVNAIDLRRRRSPAA